MTLLFEHSFDSKQTISVEAEKLTLSGGMTIFDEHEQDCCEQVYADFNALKDSSIQDFVFEKMQIFAEDEDGIIIKLFTSENAEVGSTFSVPCYNIQNGYYSGDLELFIVENDVEVCVNISNCCKYEES